MTPPPTIDIALVTELGRRVVLALQAGDEWGEIIARVDAWPARSSRLAMPDLLTFDPPTRPRPEDRIDTATYVMPPRVWAWEKPPSEAHPKPEVEGRPAGDEEIASSPRSVRALAEAHGWAVRAVYARGTVPGRARRVADSLTLRISRDGVVWIWAAWLGGKFDVAQIRRPGGLPVTVALREVKREIVGERIEAAS